MLGGEGVSISEMNAAVRSAEDAVSKAEESIERCRTRRSDDDRTRREVAAMLDPAKKRLNGLSMMLEAANMQSVGHLETAVTAASQSLERALQLLQDQRTTAQNMRGAADLAVAKINEASNAVNEEKGRREALLQSKRECLQKLQPIKERFAAAKHLMQIGSQDVAEAVKVMHAYEQAETPRVYSEDFDGTSCARWPLLPLRMLQRTWTT